MAFVFGWTTRYLFFLGQVPVFVGVSLDRFDSDLQQLHVGCIVECMRIRTLMDFVSD